MASFSEDPELCEKFRTEALEKCKSGVESGLYDQRDVDRLKTDNDYVSCFIRAFSENGSLEEPLKMVDTVFKFRKEIKLNDLTVDAFPKEVVDANCIFWKGVDKEGHKILHFRVSRNKKGMHAQEVKNYIAFIFNEHYKIKAGDRIVLIFDFTDAGVMNMDLDISKFVISCLSTYFPCILHHILLFEMSFLLSTIWKIIKGWLSATQQKKLVYVKKSDIQNYVAADQLEPHMVK